MKNLETPEKNERVGRYAFIQSVSQLYICCLFINVIATIHAKIRCKSWQRHRGQVMLAHVV